MRGEKYIKIVLKLIYIFIQKPAAPLIVNLQEWCVLQRGLVRISACVPHVVCPCSLYILSTKREKSNNKE